MYDHRPGPSQLLSNLNKFAEQYECGVTGVANGRHESIKSRNEAAEFLHNNAESLLRIVIDDRDDKDGAAAKFVEAAQAEAKASGKQLVDLLNDTDGLAKFAAEYTKDKASPLGSVESHYCKEAERVLAERGSNTH